MHAANFGTYCRIRPAPVKIIITKTKNEGEYHEELLNREAAQNPQSISFTG